MIDQDFLLQLTRKLVQTPSVTGTEGEIVRLLAGELAECGLAINVDSCGNLTATLATDRPGPTLLFDAHCDTVAISAPNAWEHDPYGAELVDGRLYGRGTSDMKGALAAMVAAAVSLDPNALCGTIVISATVLEEVLEGVALQQVIARVQPDFVVIGEATDLHLNHGGRGRAEIHLETTGKPAHSSTPHLGENAVHKMLPALQAIETLPLGQDPVLGKGIMALTDIISAPYPGYSVIPSRCRVTYDRRLLPGETTTTILAELAALPEMRAVHATIAQGEHQTYTGKMLRAEKFFPAWKLPADHPFVSNARAGLLSAGISAPLGAYRFCTNAAYSAGRANIPTVGFGPSQEALAHITDEFIELEQLYAAARGYAGMMRHINRIR
jgi:putative selenium metabolism hydrolase